MIYRRMIRNDMLGAAIKEKNFEKIRDEILNVVLYLLADKEVQKSEFHDLIKALEVRIKSFKFQTTQSEIETCLNKLYRICDALYIYVDY